DVQMTDVHTTQVLEDTHVTLTPVNPDGQQQSSSVSSQFVTSMFNPSPDASIDSLFESTPRVDVSVMTTVVPLLVSAPTLPPPSIPIMSQVLQAPAPTPTTAPSTSLQDLLNFGSLFRFNHRRDVQMTDVHTTQVLEDTHVTLTPVNPDGQQQSSSMSSQFVTSMFNPSPDASIDSLFESTPRVDVSVMTTVVPLLVSAPTLPPPSIPIMFNHRLKTLEDNFSKFMQTNQFVEAISSIPDILCVAVDLSKLELKKILIEKIESDKSIHRSDEQRNLYKGLVDAYECEKIILDIYEDTVTLKRHRDDADKDEEPSDGSDQGSKRRREENKLKSTSAPKEKASKTTSKSAKGSKSHQKTTSEFVLAEEPMQTTQDLE
nr:hypothetical protein [Tanacetum cinerariifolium]